MNTYEYYLIRFNPVIDSETEEAIKLLNKLSAEGWTLQYVNSTNTQIVYTLARYKRTNDK